MQELGQLTYNALPENDHQQINTFVWLGCAMHKDLNCFMGGCETFKTVWLAMGICGPAILPNKSNAATLQLLESQSPAEEATVGTSSSGAIRLASLAGLCFNHKNDETGHQDTY